MLTIGITEQHLNEIYSDPYISKVGYDFRPASPIINPNVVYLSAWSEKKFAGAFLAIRFSPFEFELHSLLKKSAVKDSRNLGNEIIAWAFAHPLVERITAYIIEGLESAKNFCLKLGFKFEGVRRNACRQNGKLKNVYILGMTREDWISI